MNWILAFLTAFGLTLISAPAVRTLALKIGAIDQPNERKVHQHAIVRMGGVSIFLGVAVAYWIFIPYSTDSLVFFLAALFIVGVGIVDDMIGLAAKSKLICQIAAATAVVLFGMQSGLFHGLLGDVPPSFDWLLAPILIFWIVGVTNAVNLIDGLDGLAAGVSSIAAGIVCFLSISFGNGFVTVLSLIILGSTLSFLFLNFHPATMFMGDSGSLFLGFNLAVMTLLGTAEAGLNSLLIGSFILAVPIMDTLFAIMRRAINKKPVFQADKQHLHHCLLDLGCGHRGTVLIIYAISMMFGLGALTLTFADVWLSVVTVLALVLPAIVLAEMIGLVGFKRMALLHLKKEGKTTTTLDP